GPNLPEHEIRFFPDYRGVETREHVADILAIHASIQNSELVPRETVDQFFRKAARITGGRRAGTRATGRRRSERHNLDRQAAHEKPRGPRKWEIKADLIGRHRARSRMGGSGSGGERCGRSSQLRPCRADYQTAPPP